MLGGELLSDAAEVSFWLSLPSQSVSVNIQKLFKRQQVDVPISLEQKWVIENKDGTYILCDDEHVIQSG